MKGTVFTFLLSATAALLAACGDGGSDANRHGVGADCATADDCNEGQQCLAQFKGGYCGVTPCAGDPDCPAGSACIAHTDGANYCFLVCMEKFECNDHRLLENEANCSASVTFVSGTMGRKACVPPSGS